MLDSTCVQIMEMKNGKPTKIKVFGEIYNIEEKKTTQITFDDVEKDEMLKSLYRMFK